MAVLLFEMDDMLKPFTLLLKLVWSLFETCDCIILIFANLDYILLVLKSSFVGYNPNVLLDRPTTTEFFDSLLNPVDIDGELELAGGLLTCRMFLRLSIFC